MTVPKSGQCKNLDCPVLDCYFFFFNDFFHFPECPEIVLFIIPGKLGVYLALISDCRNCPDIVGIVLITVNRISRYYILDNILTVPPYYL